MSKISIRFFNDREVRAIWDDQNAKWWFSALDIIGVLNDQNDYTKNRNYWKYVKGKLKREGVELVSVTNQLRLVAPDGKRRLTDTLDDKGVLALAHHFPSARAMRFAEWLVGGEDTIDSRSRAKAYAFFESELSKGIEVGTLRGLQQIHAYLFGGLYDFAGQVRQVNIAKGGFQFAMVQYLPATLAQIEQMQEHTWEQIIDKYVEMNIAHPFREGNGRTMRIWLDLMLKKRLGLCVDWSQVGKHDYLEAMRASVADSSALKRLLHSALTDKISDRETFMKGIDYSYYYEQEDCET